MSPTGTNTHTFSPNGDILAHGDFVFRDGKVKFKLREDHIYNGPTFYLKAPKGYIFDGATVPRFLWSVFERFGPWTRAAMYHDILYDRRIGTKAAADALFLEIMELDGVPAWKRYAMFAAVLLWPPNIWYWHRQPRDIGCGYKKTR